MSYILVQVLRLVLAMAGYTAAVIVATLTSIFLMLLRTVLPGESWQDGLITALQDLPVMVGAGLMLTFIMAFPGFCITLFLAWAYGWRNWPAFTIAGGADAVFALLIQGAYAGSFDMPIGLVLYCVPGGLAGGFIYWLVAGQFLARRQEVDVA